jgi:2-hydroxychromene-2-carboxylate isomerase
MRLRQESEVAMSVRPLQFWFEFASTYSYPAAMRLERVAAARGVSLEWRPFLLGPIFGEQGWRDSPFNIYPVKGRYMWRDLARICSKEGIALRQPSRFPRNGLLAARVACAATGESWMPEFVRAVYRANFAEDREIAEPAVVGAVLDQVGADAATWLACAQEPAAKERLRANTESAKAIGIFGAPSFVTGDELFWGNDRLEDALDWHQRRAG